MIQIVLRLGLIPEENAQAGRYLHIRFVVPFGIASKHGLKTGDEVSGINGHEFESLEDAAVTLGQLRLDQGLRFTVRRNGKLLEIKIPAEALRDLAGPNLRETAKDQFEALFRFKPPEKTKSVAVAGTFNNWDRNAQMMEGPDKEGYFTARLLLKPGVYEYKFVVDGKTLLADPQNLRTARDTGNSLLVVGSQP